MKKILTAVFLLATTIGFSQDGPPKPPPPAERWRRDSSRLESLGLSSTQMRQFRSAFLGFYNSLDSAVSKSRPVPPKKETVDELLKKRNEKLRASLNKSQQEKFQKLEPTLAPPPPPGGRPKPPVK